MISIFNDVTMTLLEKSMDALLFRQEVIANNIANANTPGFKRSYVVFEDYLREALKDEGSRMRLKKTHPLHFGSPSKIEKVKAVVKKDTSTTSRVDKNNVDIEEEMAVLAMNSINYNFAAQQMGKKLAVLRYVISEGRR